MSYHDKKYYKQRYEELDKANDKLKAEVDSLKNSIKFLLRQKNPHNVIYRLLILIMESLKLIPILNM
jgi:cell division protein FtsB